MAKKKAAQRKKDLVGFSKFIEENLRFIENEVQILGVHPSYQEDAVQDVLIRLALDDTWKEMTDKNKILTLVNQVVKEHREELLPLVILLYFATKA